MTRLHIHRSPTTCNKCGLRKLDLYYDNGEYLYHCGRCKIGWRVHTGVRGLYLEPEINERDDPIAALDEMQCDIATKLFKNNEEAWNWSCELLGGLP